MKDQMVSLARFNNRAIADRAVQMLEDEGLHPVLFADQTEQVNRDTANEDDGEWLILQMPWAEADMATPLIDEFLDVVEEEADEEAELALGQR